VGSGAPAFDPVAAALVWALSVWLLAAWSALAIRRWRNVILGLAPVVAALAWALMYIGDDPKILLLPLGAALALLVVVGQMARENAWRAANVDFWEGMRLDLAIVSLPISIGLVLLSGFIPSISIDQIVRWAQTTFVEPAREARPIVQESLGLRPLPRPIRPIDNLQAPGLPRRHMIGSGPELSRDTVMYVATNEMPPPMPGMPVNAAELDMIPRYYWRGSTYDRYNGSGWSTRDTRTAEYAAGQPAITETVTATLSATHRAVRQSVVLAKDQAGLAYAAGALVAVDRDYSVAWRPNADLFHAKVADAGEYRLDVLIPSVTESELRAASSDYPAWIESRYLELPESVPARVRTLARDLTATGATPYDRARAIESHLRTYSYTLDLPAPPPARDVVDYFLFDLKRGYCDYFSTAMVVLARAAGLPAREVVGYASGTFDRSNSRYAVSEADGHSWPEIYFPGIGWVEFEPTSARPPLARAPEAVDLSGLTWQPSSAEPLMAQQVRVSLQRWLLALGALGLLAVAAIAWLVLDAWRLSRLSPEIAIAQLYGRVYRQGRNAGAPTSPSDTPYEFGAALGRHLRTVESPGAPIPAPSAASPVAPESGAGLPPEEADLAGLVDLYVQASYSGQPQDAGARARAMRAWLALRRRLWLAWFRYRLRRKPKPASAAGPRP
jgi:transglutaminase-like putative cysteine protease